MFVLWLAIRAKPVVFLVVVFAIAIFANRHRRAVDFGHGASGREVEG